MKALCEDTSNCDSFSTADGFLRSFGHNATVNSWVSNSTCGTTGAASVQPGSCFSPSSSYVVCNNVKASGYYVVTAAFALPPFLIETACDKSPSCVGFMATTDETRGWLLGWAPASTTGTVALFATNLY